MESELKKTFGHAGIYSLGIILNRIVSFVMLPIYTRYLTPADYGVLELLEIIVDVVSIVMGLGILNGLSKYYYQLKSEGERNELVSTLFALVIGFYLMGSLMGVASSSLISKMVFGGKQYTNLIIISFLNLFLQILFFANMSYLQTRQRSLSFIILSSLNLVMKLGLNILFVIYWRMGVLGVLYSTLISYVILGGGMTFRTFSQVGIRFSREKSRELVKFGYPFVLSGLCAFITTYSDRFFLNHYTNLSNVGIYSLGYKFGFLLIMFPVQPMLNIWNVQRFEMAEREGYEQLANKFLSWFVIVTLTVALSISLLVKDVLQVMSAPAFWDAYKIVPIILLAYFFQACTGYINFGIYYTGKTKHIAYGTFIAAVIVIVLNFLLIPAYGVYGAAWATLVSFAARMIYYYAASQRLYRIDYKLEKPACVLLLAITVQLLYLGGKEWIPALNKAYLSHSFIFLMLGFFVFLLFSTKIITTEERAEIFHIMRSPSRIISQFKN